MSGYFPMAEARDSEELYWVDPDIRGILPLDGFHLPRRLARTIRQNRFRVTADRAFSRVIRACASARKGRGETWINDEIIELYSELHLRGTTHSVECWREGLLVGGLYGVAIRGAFFGESMFHLETNASKVALAYLVARLRHGGYKLLDMQWLTGHLAQFGGIEIEREDYRERLSGALGSEGDFSSLSDLTSAEEILQLITQTS